MHLPAPDSARQTQTGCCIKDGTRGEVSDRGGGELEGTLALGFNR